MLTSYACENIPISASHVQSHLRKPFRGYASIPRIVKPLESGSSPSYWSCFTLSTPYYPQSNGKVERTIGTLKAMLKRTMAIASVAQGQEKK